MKYKVERNYCDCHPETCNCNPWVVIKPDGKKLVTCYEKASANVIADAMNKKEEHV